MPSYAPSWIEVDLNKFKNNLAKIRQLSKAQLVCLPIKANAYGHGLLPIALAAERCLVDYLAISCLYEAEVLRQGGVKTNILLLGPVYEEQIERLIDLDLDLTISSRYKADLVAEICKKTGKRAKIHLKLDTGMRRIGVRPETAHPLFEFLKNEPCFDLRGVYSHFATADRPNDSFAHEQINAFSKFKDAVDGQGIIFHLANSGGTLYYPDSHFDMIRPGILSFGQIPGLEADFPPLFSLKARVGYFKVVAANCGVGYDHAYTTREMTRIVTLPIGYGDGYRRVLSNQGAVIIRGKRYPIAGRICMDQLMVDIGKAEAYVGDEAVLIGKQGDEEISLHEVTALCQTSTHEMLCLFNERIPRIYI